MAVMMVGNWYKLFHHQEAEGGVKSQMRGRTEEGRGRRGRMDKQRYKKTNVPRVSHMRVSACV